MTRGSRFNARIQVVKLPHRPMKEIGIFLNEFHWFELLDQRFFRYFIFSFPSFLLKMPRIGYISNIPYFISEMKQVSIDEIKSDKSPGMTKMALTTYCRAANIHTHVLRRNRNKFFLLS